MQCCFNIKCSPALRLDDVTLACPSPSSIEKGPENVTLSSVDLAISVTGVAEFVYSPIVQILGISPSSGAMDGGTIVTIIGDGFVQDVLRCRFAGSSGTLLGEASWFSHSIITCTSPLQQQAGSVSVDVIASDGAEISHQHVLFDYHARPAIDSLMPSEGSDEGGTLVTFIGECFWGTPSSACMFGDSLAASVRVISSSQVVCVSAGRL